MLSYIFTGRKWAPICNSKVHSLCAVNPSDHTQTSKCALVSENSEWKCIYQHMSSYVLNKQLWHLLCKCSGLQNLDIHYRKRGLTQVSSCMRYILHESIYSVHLMSQHMTRSLNFILLKNGAMESLRTRLGHTISCWYETNVRDKKKVCLEIDRFLLYPNCSTDMEI